MKRTVAVAIVLLTACSNATQPTPTEARLPTTLAPVTTAVTTTASTTTTTPPPPTTATSTTTTTTTVGPATEVTTPGTYNNDQLSIRLGFRSEVSDVATAELRAAALAILNDPAGWNRSGFTFVADEASELVVVLAEGPMVDALCLPLDTGGVVNCQNGPVVALNADRWRSAFDDWDSTLAAYRTYVVNHEVGHLIGLRHPEERCPTADKISALMEPQTTNLQGCTGNGIPLDWEIEWATNRPAVIGPDPDWDGPRPRWPLETDG